MITQQIVKARAALGTILSGHNIPEELLPILLAAHDGLLREERKDPVGQADAFRVFDNAS